MTKLKQAAKKPAPKRASAARPSPKRPAKAAPPKKGAPRKPAVAVKRSAAVKQPAVAKQPPAVKQSAAVKHPVSVKQPVAVKQPPAAKPGKPAKAAPAPAPIVLPVVPKVEAPGKFRREYRRWRELLISLRHRLLQEGSHLEEEGLKAMEQEVSVDHMADFGSDSSEQETTLQLIESNSVSLRDVDDALKRIEARTYGLCEECESLIPPARLAVIPHARLCIACQSKREGMPA